MKTIYLLGTREWIDEAPNEEEVDVIAQAEVADDIDLSILNRRTVYDLDEWNEEAYDAAVRLIATRGAIAFLASTDYVPVQWQDETALGIEHSRSEEDYMAILQQRQEARETIRTNQPPGENIA